MEEANTPIEVIANVSRVVSLAVDRITGDRIEAPLLVASAVVEGLKQFSIQSRVIYGQAAWIEVLESNDIIWAGCWGKFYSFWVATQFGEIVDLNASISHRKQVHSSQVNPPVRSLYSPPMLWSHEVPAFYRYQPEGVAELDLTVERDQRHWILVCQEVKEKCGPAHVLSGEPAFANEPILCPGRRLLDDSQQSFRLFDRAVSVRGLPDPPF